MKPESCHPPDPPPARPTFAEVYDRGADYVFRTLRRMGVAEADCPDATQEVFVIVHRRLPGYEPRERLFGWLAAIAANIAAQHRDKSVRSPSVGPSDDADDDPAGAPPAGSLSLVDPEDRIATRALVLHLLQAVEPDRRLVLILHHIDQMTTREIAEALGIPKGTVDTRLRVGQQDFKAAHRRYEARARRETGRGSILPILGPLTLLEAERDVPRLPDELRARIWSRLQHLEHGGGGGGDGGGNDGGKGEIPPPKTPSSRPGVTLSTRAASIAFGSVLGLGFLLGVLWSRAPAAKPTPAAVPPGPAATISPATGPEATGADPVPDEAMPASVPPPAPSPSAPPSNAHDERSLIVKAMGAFNAGDTNAAIAALEEHARRWHGGGSLAASRENLWIQTLLKAGRADEARERIERLARIEPGNPNLDTYRTAAGAPR